jgi:hypothetical protein
MLVWLFLCGGMLSCEFTLARAIKKQKVIKNKYTQPLIPSFVFLIFADIFMAAEALFHGKTIFSLYKK